MVATERRDNDLMGSSASPVGAVTGIAPGQRVTVWLTAAAIAVAGMLAAGAGLPTHTEAATTAAQAAGAAQDWPTYLHDNARSGASSESILTTANAPTLTQKWSYATGGSVVDSAAVVGGVAYVGSWDGYEYALNSSTGALLWKTNLGTTNDPNCTYPSLAGISSAATVQNGVVYVGGGNTYWYALNASTGAIEWSVYTGDNTPAGGHYNWSSPLIANGYAYIGIASNCDNPLVQGELLQVNLATQQVVNTAKFVPDGQVGGGIWTTPTIDAATNTIFVSTGTINQYTQTLSQAVVALDATTLAVKSHWQLPFEVETYDSDWGTTPTLTTDTAGDQLLSLANKNGVLYTFNRNNLAAGPLWQDQLAPGGDCPTCGDGTISSGVFVPNLTVTGPSGTYTGPVLFYATGNTVVNGVGYQGSVRAFNPATGATLWTHFTNGPIIAALAYDNGLLIYGQGDSLEVANASNGYSIYDYLLTQPIYSSPSISGGFVYVGGADKSEYAFGLPASVVTPPADPACPTGFTCQDISGATAGSETVNADGSWTVKASGSQIHGASDQFRLISKNVSGDGQLIADLTQQSTQNTQPQAGVMMRQSNNTASPFYAILGYPNNNPENQPQPKLVIWYRSQWGQTSVELTKLYPAVLPRYLMIQRVGDVFTGSYSTDGVHYTILPGTTKTVVMPTTLMEGVAVDSGKNGTYGTASFSHVATGPVAVVPTLLGTTHPCPSGWTCQGVDNPNPPGDQTVSNGTWTVDGAGTGIQSGSLTAYGHEDSFHYVYQSVSGDKTLTAEFTGFGSKPPAKAQAGLMMRASTDPHAQYYAILMTAGGGGIVQWRTMSNIVSRAAYLPQPSWAAPIYLRITRYSDSQATYYSASYSTDGQNWTFIVGSTAAISMGSGASGPTLVGLAADATVSYVQVPATFTNVAVTATSGIPPGVCPAGWSCADIGSGHVAGNQTYLNKVFTVQSSGDLWDVYDQYRYLWQPYKGDGTVSARVVSVQNGGEWEKSGVMIRSDAQGANDAQAPYYGVFLTPQHGIVVQWRSAEGATTNQVQYGTATSPGAPVYLMVSHYTDTSHGNTIYYTGYYSTDNVHFLQIPGSSLAMTLPLDGSGGLTAGLAATSYQSFLATTTFDNFVILGSAPPPAGLCPAQWTCEDIGGALPFGTQTNTSGAWSYTVGGSDIWTTSDQFHLDWQPLAADGTVTAHVTAQSGAGPWAKGGVMLRQSDDPAAPYYGVFVTPSNGTVVQWRTTAGASTNQIAVSGGVPTYLEVNRWTSTGATPATYYQALTSTNGTTWTAIPGSLMTVSGLSGSLLAGVAADSYGQGSAATWSMDTVAVSSGELVPQGACPNGWECEDVGGSTPAGGQNDNAGAWTVQGGGSDIWNTSDQFRLIAQTLSADGSVSAHVSAQTSTNGWAKAGVMIRAQSGDPDPSAPYYGVLVTPSNGIVVQWRGAEGATTQQLSATGAVPVFLRVTRWTDSSGATPTTYYTAYTSANGTTWTAVPGSTMALSIPGTVLAGLAVTSHDGSNLSSVSFDTVAIAAGETQPPGICPATWTCEDVGGATPAGGQTDSAGTWTVQGGGSDITGTTDQFRFIHQQLAGDGTVSAHVASQSASDPWAKAGLMVRSSSAPGAPNYAVLLTPGHGVTVQYRTAQGATTTVPVTVAGTAPLYLEIVRSGTTFTAESSSNGVNWTAIAGSSVSLPNLSGSLLAGMAVTSHNGSVLGNAVFDTVSA